jgi:hypothetical protein
MVIEVISPITADFNGNFDKSQIRIAKNASIARRGCIKVENAKLVANISRFESTNLLLPVLYFLINAATPINEKDAVGSS